VKQSHKTLLLWVLLILMFVAIYHLVSDPDQTQSVAFSDFLSDVGNGHVEQVTIRQRDNSAEYKYLVNTAEDVRKKKVSIGIVGEQINKMLVDNNVKVEYAADDQNGLWTSLLVYWLPMVFLLVIFSSSCASSRPRAARR